VPPVVADLGHITCRNKHYIVSSWRSTSNYLSRRGPRISPLTAMFSARVLKPIHCHRAILSSQRRIHASYSTVTEKVGEVADKVNKSVGRGLADAIDKGEKATSAARDTIASVTKDTTKEAGKKAQDASETVKKTENRK